MPKDLVLEGVTDVTDETDVTDQQPGNLSEAILTSLRCDSGTTYLPQSSSTVVLW